MARYMRTDLGAGHSKLRPPAVVGEGIVFPPIQGRLHPLLGAKQEQRKKYQALLREPTVVAQPVPFVARPILVSGVAERDQVKHRSLQRAPHSKLRPPSVVGEGIVFAPIYGTLFWELRNPPTQRRPQYKLRPPTVVARPFVAPPVSVNLTYSRRGVPKSRLRPPTDTVGLEDQGKIRAKLAPSPRQARATHPQLRPPVVIDLRPQVRHLSVNLAYSRRPFVHSHLAPPTFTLQEALGGIMVVYVRTPRTSTLSRLRAPVVSVAAQVYYGPRTQLVKNRPRRTVSFLRPPVIPPLAREITIVLARARPRPTEAVVRAPIVVFLAVEIYGPATSLSYSVRKRGVADIKPPTVVDVRVYSGPIVTLAYSVRGRPRYALRPPTVIDLRPQVRYIAATLAPSRRGRPMHFLRPPVLAAAKQFESVSVHLTYSVRKRGRVVLRRPVVVFPFFARPTSVTLAYQARGRVKSQLLPPAVIRERENRPIRVALALSRRGQPKSFLSPPTRVAPFFARPINVTLAPQSRGKIRSTLLPPAVVREFIARSVLVALAKIKPQPTTKFLRPPTVVETPQPVLYPVAVTLAYSLRGKPIFFLRPPQVLIFVPDQGDVCGDDEAVTEVCGNDETIVDVCSDENAGSVIEGMSSSGSSISGSDGTLGTVSGSDSENT